MRSTEEITVSDVRSILKDCLKALTIEDVPDTSLKKYHEINNLTNTVLISARDERIYNKLKLDNPKLTKMEFYEKQKK